MPSPVTQPAPTDRLAPRDPGPACTRRRPRRGSIYLPVLLIGMIVSAMAIGGIVSVRSTARAFQLRTDAAEARALALAGLETARATINSDPTWRTSRSAGTWLSGVPLGNGTFSVSVVNPAGALSRAATDPVVVTATASVRSARQTLSCTLAPAEITPRSSLNASAGARQGLSFNSATVTGASQLISTNAVATASVSGNSVSPDLETGVTVVGLTGFTGSRSVLATPRNYPTPAAAFESYLAQATAISYTSLPSGNSGRILRRTLLSPASNPFGTTNSRGIYLIDCAGGALTIEDLRVVGTLVVINASGVTVRNAVHWAPASADLPALLVRGPLSLATGAADLTETSASANLNPTGTPYPLTSGTTDSDTADAYPSRIEGLVYASGNITTSGSVDAFQILSDGTLSISGALRLRYDRRHLDTPPEGFYQFRMLPTQNSHQ